MQLKEIVDKAQNYNISISRDNVQVSSILKKLERQSVNLIKRLQPKKPLEMRNNSSEEEVVIDYSESPKIKNN